MGAGYSAYLKKRGGGIFCRFENGLIWIIFGCGRELAETKTGGVNVYCN